MIVKFKYKQTKSFILLKTTLLLPKLIIGDYYGKWNSYK